MEEQLNKVRLDCEEEKFYKLGEEKRWKEAASLGLSLGIKDEKLSLWTWLGFGTEFFLSKNLPVVPGIDIKQRDKRTRVRILWPFSGQEVSSVWKKMTKNGGWDNIRLLSEKEFGEQITAVVNSTLEEIETQNTILFHMEPYVIERPEVWGPNWTSNLQRREFLATRFHQETPNPLEWHLSLNREEILSSSPEKKFDNVMSCVISSRFFEQGHKKRVEFLKFLQSTNEIKTAVFGRDNDLCFENYLGSLPSHKKDDALLPYKYTFNAESASIHNYFTEKLVDALLSETLCFYWGCPNLHEFFDPRAFIWIDLDNKELAVKTIKDSIKNCEWEKRLEVIKRQKKKIVDCLSFFPTLNRILHPPSYETKQEMLLVELLFKERHRGYYHETDEDIPRYFRDVMFWEEAKEENFVDILCQTKDLEKINTEKINCVLTRSSFLPFDFFVFAKTTPEDGNWKILIKKNPSWTWSLLKSREILHEKEVFLINLDRRTDRLERFKLSHPNLKFERFSAFDGRNLQENLEIPINGISDVSEFFGAKLSDPAKGCCLSHATIWQNFLNSEKEYLVVLEDDVILTLDFERKLDSLLPFSGDILYLGVSLEHGDLYQRSRDRTKDPRILDFSLFESSLRGGTFGMLLTKQGVKKLLENLAITKFLYPVDYFIFYNLGKYDISVAFPFLVFSDVAEVSGDSDIQ